MPAVVICIHSADSRLTDEVFLLSARHQECRILDSNTLPVTLKLINYVQRKVKMFSLPGPPYISNETFINIV